MKIIFLIPFICLCTLCFGQNERHLKEFFKKSLTYTQIVEKLKVHESNTSVEEKEIKFGKFKNYLKSLFPNDENFENIEPNEVIFIDLNGDGVDDVIYLNSIGLPSTEIYIDSHASYRKVLGSIFNPSYITELTFNDRKCVRLVLSYDDNYITQGERAETVYKLKNDSFELSYFRFSRLCTFTPKLFFETPINLKTHYNSSPLRENPKIGKGECFFKETSDSFYNENNNIIVRYFKDTECFCWAKFIDKKGNIWYLVEMPRLNELTSEKNITKDFHSLEKEFQIGWMEAKFLDKIK